MTGIISPPWQNWGWCDCVAGLFHFCQLRTNQYHSWSRQPSWASDFSYGEDLRILAKMHWERKDVLCLFFRMVNQVTVPEGNSAKNKECAWGEPNSHSGRHMGWLEIYKSLYLIPIWPSFKTEDELVSKIFGWVKHRCFWSQKRIKDVERYCE